MTNNQKKVALFGLFPEYNKGDLAILYSIVKNMLLLNTNINLLIPSKKSNSIWPYSIQYNKNVDVLDLIRRINRLVEDNNTQNRLIANGFKFVQQYNFINYKEKLINIYSFK